MKVEYAMEAVKQGSTCVGARSSTHAVLATLKRQPGNLSGFQKKVLLLFLCKENCLISFQIIEVDDHIGVAISGLTSDARVLSRYMRNECLNHKYVFNTPMITGRLVRKVADSMNFFFLESFFILFLNGWKFRITSSHSTSWASSLWSWSSCHWLRCSFLILILFIFFLPISQASSGPHLYETCPSGNFYDYKAQALGSRCQSAKTYLEKKFATFDNCNFFCFFD